MRKKQISIMWFRRDLRLSDNKALSFATKGDYPVAPIFIFDDHILNKLKNKKDKRLIFIWDSINVLTKQLQKHSSTLHLFKGRPEDIFKELFEVFDIRHVFCNEDYEPYAIKRDKKISLLCNRNNSVFESFKDHVVFRGDEILKNDNTAYKVYTPYKNAWLRELRPEHLSMYRANLKSLIHIKNKLPHSITSFDETGFEVTSTNLIGGEITAKKLFKKFLDRIDLYDKNRDAISLDTNSGLSPYIRFGCISIRELMRKVYFLDSPGSKVWLSELIWRDFYQMILFNFPEVEKKEFLSKYRNIKWLGGKNLLKKWKEGKTGYPIIDAAMINFSKTGQMHNRLRMIVASFLVKDLLIDWREGEKYFAEKLLDFDLASNNGGWQWSASTGCDAQPYFRIFNPYTQSKKFDPEAAFILKHLPMLKDFPSKFVHTPHLASEDVQESANCIIGKDYPKPIVDHAKNRLIAIDMFKHA